MLIYVSTLKPRYSEQVRQTLFVHYIEKFTISNVICLVDPQNESWVLFTILQNSVNRGSLYQGLGVACMYTSCTRYLLIVCKGFFPLTKRGPIIYFFDCPSPSRHKQRKCSIKAHSKCKTTVYVLMEISHQ